MWTVSNWNAFTGFIEVEAEGYPRRSLAWLDGTQLSREGLEAVAGIVAAVATGRMLPPDRWTLAEAEALAGFGIVAWQKIRTTPGAPVRERTEKGGSVDRTSSTRTMGRDVQHGGQEWADQVQAVQDRAAAMVESVRSDGARRTEILADDGEG